MSLRSIKIYFRLSGINYTLFRKDWEFRARKRRIENQKCKNLPQLSQTKNELPYHVRSDIDIRKRKVNIHRNMYLHTALTIPMIIYLFITSYEPQRRNTLTYRIICTIKVKALWKRPFWQQRLQCDYLRNQFY